MREVSHNLYLIESIIKGEIFHHDIYHALLCKFADRPGIVALYAGDFSTKKLEVLTEAEAIEKGSEAVAAVLKQGKQLRTQELNFRSSSEFYDVVTNAALISYGSPTAARPFLASLDTLVPPQA